MSLHDFELEQLGLVCVLYFVVVVVVSVWVVDDSERRKCN